MYNAQGMGLPAPGWYKAEQNLIMYQQVVVVVVAVV